MKLPAKKKALQMRKDGWSYNDISNELNVSKSTLSHWLKDIRYRANRTVIKRIDKARAKSAEVRNAKKLDSIAKADSIASADIGKLSERDLFMFGLGFYLGEGSKIYEEVRLVNSDPEAIKLSMSWFRRACGVTNNHFSITIHGYPDTDFSKALNFWSRITGVPKRQFRKNQIDMRQGKSAKKSRSLPYGTIHVKVTANGKPEFGVFLHRRIIGWLKHTLQQARA